MKIILSAILLAAVTCAAAPPPRVHHNLERLNLPRLKSVHDDDERLKAQRVPLASLPEEREELEQMMEVERVLSLAKAKARAELARAQA